MDAVYSHEFSKKVVSEFLKKHARGWQLFEKEFPNLNQARAEFIFSRYRRRWYVLKKSIKLADRLLQSPWYADSDTIVLHNVFAQLLYFAGQSEISEANMRLNQVLNQYLSTIDKRS